MDYKDLVGFYKKLGSTQSSLEKTSILSDLFSGKDDRELEILVKLCMGRIFSAWKDEDIGISSKLMVKALKKVSGSGEKAINQEWKSTGDLGKTAENLLGRKRQQTFAVRKLTVEKVHENLKAVADFEGSGSQSRKIDNISELLSMANPEEAKYIVRTVLRNMRLGVGEGIVRDAILEAFFPIILDIKDAMGEDIREKDVLIDKKVSNDFLEEEKEFEPEIFNFGSVKISEIEYDRFDVIILDKTDARKLYSYLKDAVQHGYDVTNDFGDVAVTAKNRGIKGLLGLEMKIFRPVNAMLAKKVDTIKEGFETVGKPAGVDYKYDGMRAQLHKKDDEVKVFTRRLDDVTEQFPDVEKAVKEFVKSDECIIDSELVAYDPDDGSTVPFQKLSKRIKRKYDIDEMVENIPVEIRPFDIIYLEKALIKRKYSERFEKLESIIEEENDVIRLVDRMVTDNEEDVNSMQQRSLSEGQEGIMMKNLDAEYKPGSRVGYMVKLKPVMETLDLVIIGAEWSEGRRSGWLGSLTMGCKDDDGNYLEVGKLATGLTDKQLEEITNRLEPLIVEEDGRQVKVSPEVVVEAEFEEIQKSPTYTSGFALRFPRLKRFRDDKEDADSIEKVARLYKSQN